MSPPATDVDALLAKLNRYAGGTSTDLSDTELAYLREQLTSKKKYGLIWEDKPEAVEQQLLTGLPVLTEVAERRVENRKKPEAEQETLQPVSAPTDTTAQLPLAFVSDKSGSLVDYHQSTNDPDLSERIPDTNFSDTVSLAPDFSPRNTITNHTLIEGDNLHALTVLNYTHAGQVDVIYIDPPYNTGNKDFKYNDSFVDREDSYRHSKWLSFMAKRLRLAKTLLKDTGVIFISIDDNEQAQLKLLCDEVFGEENFVATFIWKSRQNKDNRNVTGASIDHEYVVCYGSKLRGSQRDLSQYKNPDDDRRGDWTSSNMVGLATADKRPNLHYDLIHPTTKINYGKPQMGWRYEKKTMLKLIEEDKVLWPKDDSGRPRRKFFLTELNEQYTGYSSLVGSNIYTNSGSKEIDEIFQERKFAFPKPTSFIRELLEQGGDDDALVLDFFAGSGTTLHAVMALNAEDGGNRRCILVTNNENNIAEEVCYERNRRVIQGYTNSKGTHVLGLSGNALRYYRTALVGREKTLANKRALMRQATDLLCLKEGCYDEAKERMSESAKEQSTQYANGMIRLFTGPDARAMLLVYDPDAIDAAVALIQDVDLPSRIKVYVFAPASYPFTDEFESVADRVDLCALPDAIYQAYDQVFNTLRA